MKWYEHLIGAASLAAIVGGIAMMAYGLRPPSETHGPLPYDAQACLRAGHKLVIDFKANRVTCETS